MRLDVVALWCQPAPAFFEFRCVDSGSGSFSFRLTPVDASKCSGWSVISYLINGLFSP